MLCHVAAVSLQTQQLSFVLTEVSFLQQLSLEESLSALPAGVTCCTGPDSPESQAVNGHFVTFHQIPSSSMPACRAQGERERAPPVSMCVGVRTEEGSSPEAVFGEKQPQMDWPNRWGQPQIVLRGLFMALNTAFTMSNVFLISQYPAASKQLLLMFTAETK